MVECNYIDCITLFPNRLTPACNGKTVTRQLHPTGNDAFALTEPFDPCLSLC